MTSSHRLKVSLEVLQKRFCVFNESSSTVDKVQRELWSTFVLMDFNMHFVWILCQAICGGELESCFPCQESGDTFSDMLGTKGESVYMLT